MAQTHAECQRRYEKKLKALGLFVRGKRNTRIAYTRRYRIRFPERRAAHMAIANALARKKLIKPLFCSICGNDQFIMGHHKDYAERLKVEWMCFKCHNELHQKEKGGEELKMLLVTK